MRKAFHKLNRKLSGNKLSDISSDFNFSDLDEFIVFAITHCPSFNKVGSKETTQLLIRKLKLCSVTFNFTDSMDSSKIEQFQIIKASTLKEIHKFLTNNNLSEWYSAKMVSEMVKMFNKNIFRSPVIVKWIEPDVMEEETNWEHIKMIYKIFSTFVSTTKKQRILLEKNMNVDFFIQLIGCFNTENQIERQYLSDLIHLLYTHLLSRRVVIRKIIDNVLYNIIYNNEIYHYGIAELLRFIACIIGGFLTPIRSNNKTLLCSVLLPLLKVDFLEQFHKELIICFKKFISKENELCQVIIGGILKFWPSTPCKKQTLFFKGLNEILNYSNSFTIHQFIKPIFKKMCNGMCSIHFQVSQSAFLMFQNNTNIRSCLYTNRQVIFPVMRPYLLQNSKDHWNEEIRFKILGIIQYFKDLDPEFLYLPSILPDTNDKKRSRQLKWAKIRSIATNV